MKPMSELLADNSSHENWIPLLEVATREVFEAHAEFPTDRAGGRARS